VAVFRRDDLERNSGSTASVLRGQRFLDELGKWSSRLNTQLLEITHGQWLYWIFMVHNPVSGTIATAKKEEILLEIECQQKLEDAGLLKEDKYLVEVNMGDKETTLGKHQHYWLLTIKTVWKTKLLWEQQEQQQTVSGSTI
jgi:hypothetical protein